MKLRWIAPAAALALLASCGAPAPVDAGPREVRAEGVSRAEPRLDAPVAAVAKGLAAFGYKLGTAVGPAENWVISPASVGYGFAMVRAGAGGDTAAEIDGVFGFPPAGVHDAFNAITRGVVTADVPPTTSPSGATRTPGPAAPPVVCIANALFPREGAPVGAEFLRTLAAQYGAGVYPVDFTRPSAKEAIDAWVRRQTAGRVRELAPSLAADSRLVVANAVYLRADWRYPFAKQPTTDEAFRRDGGAAVTVPTMHLSETLRYAAGPGWQAVELPLAGDELAMWVLVPGAAGGQKPTPLDLLAPTSLAAIAGGLEPEAVGLALPRFEFASDVDLTAALATLGMSRAFGASADFSGIGDGLHIDRAVHKANITVDEWGTEAAAVTGLVVAPSGPVPPRVQVRADHPFAFAIVHLPTAVPLFMGRVGDPSRRG